MTKFDVSFRIVENKTPDRTPISDFETTGGVKARFDAETGALSSYALGGKEYLAGAAFRPVVYDDNEDPWGWDMKTVGKNLRYAEPTVTLRTIEKGDLLTEVESNYDTGRSDVRVDYTLYKDFDYIDLTVSAYWNDPGKGLKIEIPLAEVGKFIGQTAFGTQTYTENLEECSQRFVGVEIGDRVLAVFKDGTYGCSIEDGKLYIDLLNGSVYCAHPVGELPIIDPAEFNRYIEPGRHEFRLRLAVCRREELEREAQRFVEQPYALNFYPHGEGKLHETAPITVSDDTITLSCFRKTKEDTFMARLFNNSESQKKCDVTVFGEKISLDFGKYEVKTLLLRDGKLIENASMLDL
jgi:alpha-mannosidase